MTTAHLFELLSPEDFNLAHTILGPHAIRDPDLIIAPDGEPYIYRWHVIPRNAHANVYFHIQVADDPERPLHDHPWDNTSVLLAGSYIELISDNPALHATRKLERKVGQTIQRRAEWAHRLLLPEGVPYMMSLFSTGPKIREWGFWCADPRTGYPTWRPHTDCIVTAPDERSIFREPTDVQS